jgi:membrane protein YqaA with SNARE-associated domain
MDAAKLIGLFLTCFLSATIVPFSSELVLAGVAKASSIDAALLWAVATAGNTLGSVLNWALGRGGAHYRDRPWFPVKPPAYEKASARFNRYGLWSLAFSWLPIVGDALTLVAGALGVRFLPFLVLVALGKGARYAVLLFFV